MDFKTIMSFKSPWERFLIKFMLIFLIVMAISMCVWAGTTHFSAIETTGNMTCGGNFSSSGTTTFADNTTISTDKKHQFRNTGVFIQSHANGKMKLSADGTGDDDITVAGTIYMTDNATINTTKKIYFNNTGTYINSPASGKMSIVADGTGPDDITLSGTVSAADNITLDTNKKIQFRNTGIYINSGANGKLTIAADGTNADDITLAGTVIVSDALAGTSGSFSSNLAVTGKISAPRTEHSQMFFIDDFLENPAVLASTTISKAHWTGGGTSGTQTIQPAPNGIMQLATTATGNRSSTLTFSNAAFDNDNSWIFETTVMVGSKTNTRMNIGMFKNTSDYVMFMFDTAVHADRIFLSSNNNNAGAVNENTGVNLTTATNITFRLEALPDDTFKAYINDTEVVPAHTGTIRDEPFKPYFYVDNKNQAENKTMDIDFVRMWQTR